MYKYRSLDSSPVVLGEGTRIPKVRPIVAKPLAVERQIGLGLIDSRKLMRCSISDLLANYAPEFSVFSYSSCSELVKSPDNEKERIDLLVMDVDGAEIGSSKCRVISILYTKYSPAFPLFCFPTGWMWTAQSKHCVARLADT